MITSIAEVSHRRTYSIRFRMRSNMCEKGGTLAIAIDTICTHASEVTRPRHNSVRENCLQYHKCILICFCFASQKVRFQPPLVLPIRRHPRTYLTITCMIRTRACTAPQACSSDHAHQARCKRTRLSSEVGHSEKVHFVRILMGNKFVFPTRLSSKLSVNGDKTGSRPSATAHPHQTVNSASAAQEYQLPGRELQSDTCKSSSTFPVLRKGPRISTEIE